METDQTGRNPRTREPLNPGSLVLPLDHWPTSSVFPFFTFRPERIELRVMKKKPAVAIVMGSDSDLAVMAETAKTLDEFGVEHEVLIVSAHRTPDRCRTFARGAAGRGIKVIVAGAGKAAHLAGVIAAHTTLPVIGVPLDAGMNGLDALLSTVQMPGGVPVACMAVGKAGAKNAGLLAVEILALEDIGLTKRLAAYRARMAREVAAKARAAVHSGGRKS